MTSGELVAVDAIVTVPEADPATLGAKVAVKLALPPAAICCPDVIPLAVKPAPAAVMLLTLIAVLPLLVSVIVWALLLPTSTLPKLKLPGFAPSVAPAALPLPFKLSVWGECFPLSLN